MSASGVEAALRERFDVGDLHAVATLAIEAYGGEVCGYLAAVLRDDERARDVFADTTVDLWRNLSRFRWEASLRTWIYLLARHRLAAHLGRARREPAVALSQVPEIAEPAATPRSITAPYRRTDVKDLVSRLRQDMPVEDQTLLILRIDRKMSWHEIACIVTDRNEAALRKRFERVKQRLRDLAKAHVDLAGNRSEAC